MILVGRKTRQLFDTSTCAACTHRGGATHCTHDEFHSSQRTVVDSVSERKRQHPVGSVKLAPMTVTVCPPSTEPSAGCSAVTIGIASIEKVATLGGSIDQSTASLTLTSTDMLTGTGDAGVTHATVDELTIVAADTNHAAKRHQTRGCVSALDHADASSAPYTSGDGTTADESA